MRRFVFLALTLLLMKSCTCCFAQESLYDLESEYLQMELNNQFPGASLDTLERAFYVGSLTGHIGASFGPSVIVVQSGQSVQAAVSAAVAAGATVTNRYQVVVTPGVSRVFTPATGVDVVFMDDAANQPLAEVTTTLCTLGEPILASGRDVCRRQYTIDHPCSTLVLQFGNDAGSFNHSTGAMDASAGAYSDQFEIAACTVEDAAGDLFPVTFGGQRTVVVPGNESWTGVTIVRSDPIPLMCNVGDTIYVRSEFNNDGASGQPGYIPELPANSLTDVYLDGTVDESPADAIGYCDTPFTQSPWTSAIAAGPAYPQVSAPTAILGTIVNKKKPNVVIVGDSIQCRYNIGDGQGTQYMGVVEGDTWLSKFLRDHGMMVSISARSSEYMAHAWQWEPRIAKMVNDADVIICCLGFNDLTDLADWKTIAQAFWANLPKGKRIIQTTIASTTGGAGGNTNTVAINNWLRTVPAPLSGIIDFDDLLTTSRNSGVYKSIDGISYVLGYPHPSYSTGVAAIQDELEDNASTYLPILDPNAIIPSTIPYTCHKLACVAVTTNNTYVGVEALGTDSAPTGNHLAFTIPAGVLRSLVVTVTAPSGTAGGTQTINYAVGTTQNTGTTLTGTAVNIMAAVGAQTAASGPFTAFPNLTCATPTELYFNFIGDASGATATPGTVSAYVTIRAYIDRF